MALLSLDGLQRESAQPTRDPKQRELVDAPRVGLTIEEGDLVLLTGGPGSGKSQYIEALASRARQLWGWMGQAGFRPGDDMGQDLRPLGRCCSVVHPQSFFDPRKSVFENVNLPLRIAGLGGPRWATRVRTAMDMLELPTDDAPLGPMEDLHPEFRQRVGWARALATDPLLLLVDDAMHNLRADIQKTLIDAMRDRVRRQGAVVWATRVMPTAFDSVSLRWIHLARGTIVHDERFVREKGKAAALSLSAVEEGMAPQDAQAPRSAQLSSMEDRRLSEMEESAQASQQVSEPEPAQDTEHEPEQVPEDGYENDPGAASGFDQDARETRED